MLKPSLSSLLPLLLFAPLVLPSAALPGRAQTLMAPAGGSFRVQPINPQATEQPVADPSAGQLNETTACPMKLQSLRQDHQALKARVAALETELASYTSKGGSRVTAYCESSTVSRNTAGVTSNCAVAGYGCDPVTGLCRTTAQSTDHCAPGFVWCATSNACVNSPSACH